MSEPLDLDAIEKRARLHDTDGICLSMSVCCGAGNDDLALIARVRELEEDVGYWRGKAREHYESLDACAAEVRELEALCRIEDRIKSTPLDCMCGDE